ncbi:MAG: hypothetical protein B7Y12_12945 [Rhizobiales bacterium 24-66-13]|jgi:hypothetical protein|nr:MAG: hypothetical protein B7Y12_12945 [Rhizobiales bacterium 24-66-13]
MASDPKTPAQDKSARLAQALRANLARRKAQGRARKEETVHPADANPGSANHAGPEAPAQEGAERAPDEGEKA